MTQLYLTLEDDMTDGCRALGEQLKRFAKHNIFIIAKVAQILHLNCCLTIIISTRFPVQEIHASRKALQGTDKDCLQLVKMHKQ